MASSYASMNQRTISAVFLTSLRHVAICRYHPSPSTMLGCQTTICCSGQSRYHDLLHQSRQSCVGHGTDSASTCCGMLSSSQSSVSLTAGQTCQSTSSLYYTTARLHRYWMSSSQPVLSPLADALLIHGLTAIAAKPSVTSVVLNDWLAAVAHLMPQLPGLRSDVNTVPFVDRNAKRSGVQRSKPRSHRRVSCGALSMHFLVAAALHTATISVLMSSTSSSTTRLLECGQQQQTRHHRHSRRRHPLHLSMRFSQ